MKKIIFLVVILGITILAQSCGTKMKGEVIRPSQLSELKMSEEKELNWLFDGDIFARVVLENGDTINAVISQKTFENKLSTKDLEVEVTIDKRAENFHYTAE